MSLFWRSTISADEPSSFLRPKISVQSDITSMNAKPGCSRPALMSSASRGTCCVTSRPTRPAPAAMASAQASNDGSEFPSGVVVVSIDAEVVGETCPPVMP